MGGAPPKYVRMEKQWFNKKDLLEILGLVVKSLDCEVDEDIIKMLGGIKTLLGGESSACAIGKWKGGAFSGAAMVINEGFPTQWHERYDGGELYRECPVILNIMNNPGPYILDAEKCPACRVEGSGLRQALVSAMYDNRTGLASIFHVLAPPGSFFDRHISIAEVLTPSVHKALERVYRGWRAGGKTRLTKREREVLRWVCEGKTNWEIAMILNISERTVKFHIHNILEKLNAVNKAHAVAIASKNRLLD